MQPATEDRRDRGRDGEDHGHVRHHALGGVAFINITHHRATDHQSRAGGDPLQGAEKPECANARRERATDRGQRQHRERDQNYPPPSERIGDRAMPEAHERERNQIRGQALLNLERTRA